MKIREMEVLVRVAEAGSMTRAARQLDLTPAAVSATVQRAETALGLRLFERTTRTLHPTREGQIIVEGCQQTIRRWRRALDEARGDGATLEGLLRVAAPADTTEALVGPAVAAFAEAHPGVRVVTLASDSLQDVLGDALDITIRYGVLRDSTLVARRLAEGPRVMVAAPAYLRARGTPTVTGDLIDHRLLTLQIRNSPEQTWTMHSEGRVVSLSVRSPLCGDGLTVRRWAVAGHGIAFKSLFDVVDDLDAGRLVRVLPDVDGGTTPIHAVLPSRRFVPARVRAFVDVLAERFGARAERCAAWDSRSTRGASG